MSRLLPIVVLLIAIELCFAFIPTAKQLSLQNSVTRRFAAEKESDKPKEWDKKKIPLPRKEFFTQKMDATWGRGKFREEVWEDRGNPENFWWEAYMPSQQEIEAFNAGFDFEDPKKWFEVSQPK
jgi:hypothetical protein